MRGKNAAWNLCILLRVYVYYYAYIISYFFFTRKLYIQGVDLRKKKIIYFDPTGDGLSDCSDFSNNIR